MGPCLKRLKKWTPRRVEVGLQFCPVIIRQPENWASPGLEFVVFIIPPSTAPVSCLIQPCACVEMARSGLREASRSADRTCCAWLNVPLSGRLPMSCRMDAAPLVERRSLPDEARIVQDLRSGLLQWRKVYLRTRCPVVDIRIVLARSGNFTIERSAHVLLDRAASRRQIRSVGRERIHQVLGVLRHRRLRCFDLLFNRRTSDRRALARGLQVARQIVLRGLGCVQRDIVLIRICLQFLRAGRFGWDRPARLGYGVTQRSSDSVHGCAALF